jgi:ribosomal protein S18 acetylase RimI-like enzyme
VLDEFSWRPARADDYGFALALYLESTRPLLVALGRWDEETVPKRFAKGFNPEQTIILTEGGADIGWLQVSESADEVHIDQLHLVNRARNNGVGTRLVREQQERASAAGKALALNVIRGNRAQQLYERLGFRVDGGDAEKIHMIWRQAPRGLDPSAAETDT